MKVLAQGSGDKSHGEPQRHFWSGMLREGGLKLE